MFLIHILHALRAEVLPYRADSPPARGSVVLFAHSPSADYDVLSEFALASDLVPGVPFVHVDCAAHSDFCELSGAPANAIHALSARRAVFPASREPIGFEIADFAATALNAARAPASAAPARLSRANLTAFVTRLRCCLVAFLDLRDRQSQLVTPQLAELAHAFRSDADVGIAYVDCGADVALCLESGVDAAPTLRAYGSGRPTDYSGARLFPLLLRFANGAFGTHRRSDGGRDSEFGTVPGARALVCAFMRAPGDSAALARLRALPVDDYGAVAAKIARRGAEAIARDRAKHRRYRARGAEWADARLNVLAQFEECARGDGGEL